MIIFPAIDIRGGKCVRLLKGNFKDITQYRKSPTEQAKEFYNLGFNNIHIVDLDSALGEKFTNQNIVKEICKINKVKIQIGGGIRSFDQIKKLLDFGVDKVILGSAAIKERKFLEEACKKFPNQIALGLDAKDGYLAISGWTEESDKLTTEYLKKVKDYGVSRIIYTDINRDGTKQSPNFEETQKVADISNCPIVISGGVSSIDDIKKAKELNNDNIEGIIVGKAIYDRSIDIKKLSEVI